MNFTAYMNSLNFEIGYKLFIYLITRVTSSPHFILFLIQFIIILFVYLFAYRSRKETNMTFVIIIYMLLWYCVSFTFMRQSISMAIILYSIPLFKDKKYFKTILLFLLAVSFHSAAIIAILIYLFIILSKSKITKKHKILIYTLFAILLIFSVIFFEELLYFFTTKTKLLPDRYYYYVKTYFQEEGVSMGSELILRLCMILSLMFYSLFTNKKNVKINISFVLLLLTMDFATFILSYKIVNISRMGLYFFYPAVFYLIPNVSFAFEPEARKFISICFIIVMSIYWIWKFPVSNWCETYPYRLDIIEFLH